MHMPYPDRIPDEVIGFIHDKYFFYRRRHDKRWCCIHSEIGPQDLGKMDEIMLGSYYRNRIETFYEGDTLEFKL